MVLTPQKPRFRRGSRLIYDEPRPHLPRGLRPSPSFSGADALRASTPGSKPSATVCDKPMRKRLFVPAQLACALAMCVLVAGNAGATPKETHKLGVAAIEAGRWTDAERFFRAAIAERPQEKFNRLTKSAYLPHYYLGVALAESGKCQAALGSWKESNKQGQIQKSDLAGDLGRRRKRCQNHLRQVAAAKTEVEQLLSRVDEASASLSSLSKMPELVPLWNQGDPSFGSRQQSAGKKLADAKGRFDTGDGDLDRLDQAKTMASSALSEFNRVITDARQRLGQLNADAAAALEQLEEVEQNARRVLRSIADLAPYPQRLGSRVAAVDRTLKEIRKSKSGSSAQRLSELTGELNNALRALRSAARRPPKELTQAVEAFLSGSYQDALALLETPSLAEDPRTKPHVCLIRAASGHALWVLDGERDDTLHDLATEAILACAGGQTADEPPSLEPSLPLSLKFFSPRFVEFHDATVETYAADLAAIGDEEPGAGVASSAAPTAGDAPPEAGEVSVPPEAGEGADAQGG